MKRYRQQGGFQGLTASAAGYIPLSLNQQNALGQHVKRINNRNGARKGILRIDKQTGVRKFPVNLGSTQNNGYIKNNVQRRRTDKPVLTPGIKRRRGRINARAHDIGLHDTSGLVISQGKL